LTRAVERMSGSSPELDTNQVLFDYYSLGAECERMAVDSSVTAITLGVITIT